MGKCARSIRAILDFGNVGGYPSHPDGRTGTGCCVPPRTGKRALLILVIRRCAEIGAGKSKGLSHFLVSRRTGAGAFALSLAPSAALVGVLLPPDTPSGGQSVCAAAASRHRTKGRGRPRS